MMGIRLSVFDHDPLIFWRAPPNVRARGEHFIHYSMGIFRCHKIKIEIASDRFNAADALYASNLALDLLGNFLGSLRHRNFFPFASPRFVRRSLEEGCRYAPFAR